MERQLLERMIGAVVLLVALVVIVPAILSGRPDVDDQPQSKSSGQDSTAADAPMRQVTIRLDSQAETPPVARQAAVDPVQQDESFVAPEPGPTQQMVATEPEDAAPPPVEPEPAAVSQPEPQPKPQPKPKPQPETVAKTSSAALESGWIVQLGSFSNRANAQGLVDRTRASGFEPFLMSIERSGKTLYRVRVGPPRKTRDEASKLADDLRKAGFTGQVAEQVAEG